MKKIGGNITATIKTKKQTNNAIGEKVTEWVDYKTLTGFLDFMAETTGRTNYNSKIVESTHVFVCDYEEIDKPITDLKFYCDSKEFDITYIDDPMNLHYQLEIFLKYVGD